jgi:GT2 family glycosyltransferase
MTRDDSEPALGVVAIGRNEGERLRRCLESVRQQCAHVVYVDSGSQDGSVTMARGMGVDVIELDLSIPFTAARARNEGLRRLRELRPDVEFVQFVDGDCELVAGWIAAGLESLLERADLAVVGGRVRERYRKATIYNRLCDLEWNTPVGEAEACGGNALMRVSAFEHVGGFDPNIMAGEEPELCVRLRSQGYTVLRIDADMVLHDAAMTRMLQWWRRTVRTGYGIAESIARPGSAQRADLHRMRSVIVWAIAFPALVTLGLVLAAQRSSIPGMIMVAGGAAGLLIAQTVRIALKRNSPGENAGDAALYAAACMAAKPPQLVGMLRYLGHRLIRHRPRLFEYK